MAATKRPATAPRTRRPPDSPDRPAIVGRVCAEIARGTLVKDACRAAGISRDTLHRWTTEDPALSDAYACAREDQAHAIAEEALSIADEAVETSEAVARNRLRVDTRKWMASKIAPRNYGDRIQQDVTLDITNGLAEKLAAARQRVAHG